MSKWELVKLKDCCNFIDYRGKTPEKSETGIPLITAKNVKNNSFSIEPREYIPEVNYESVMTRGIPKENDILFTTEAPLGNVCRIPHFETRFAVGQRIIVMQAQKDKLIAEFLEYSLKSNTFQNEMWKHSSGSTVKGIRSKELVELFIPIPSLDFQKKIADTLDKTQEIIDCNKKQLEELDNLVKATFYDMFGDPRLNDKEWNVRVCKDLTTKIGSGSTPSGGNESYKEFGISLVRSLNVHNGYFKYDDLAHIDEKQAEKLKNVIVEKNDVLLNITGASVARSCIVPNDVLPARVNQHVAIVRPDTNYLNHVFLNCLFTDDSYQQKLWELATGNGATREAITKQQIEALEIILPPLDLQTKFAEIVTNIEQQKNIVKQSLTESQNLFNSLMSKYFD